jgi:hypothetical protein
MSEGMAMSRPMSVARKIRRCRAASFRGVVQAGLPDVAENRHHARNGADEAEQRRDADDDFQHDEAAFEPDDFMARGGLERVHVVGLGPVEAVGGEQQQASERRRFLQFADTAQRFSASSRVWHAASDRVISGGTTFFQRNEPRSTMNASPTTEVSPSKM